MIESDISNASYSRFACIGTGLSGIGLGATLKRWYQIDDVHFFERQGGLGGTWWANQYPGCACDVPNLLYSFSFEPNPDWTRILAKREELYEYIMGVASKYDLLNKMTFGAEVEKCLWIEEDARWRLTIRDVNTGSTYFHECQFLFSATGIFSTPRKLDVPGVEKFTGPIMHTTSWRHDVDLTGKRVIVFGNGATAVQLIPSILDKVRHITQIVRSKHWILPPIDGPALDTLRWAMRNIPGIQRLLRLVIYVETERQYRLFATTEAGERARAGYRKISETYMRTAAPVKYHEMLIPDFEFGCKRRIHDWGYLPSLHSDKLLLTDEAVTEILPYGVRMASGRVTETDVIVLANGFETSNFLDGIEVIGRGGRSLHQHWDQYGGAEAYNTTSVSGFPNFFILYGPNAAAGHTSAIISLENGINYTLRVIKPILDGKASIVDVKPAAESQWTQAIQTGTEATVFYSGCRSWFIKTNENGKRWNATVYPFSQGNFWRRTFFPTWKDLEFSGPAAAFRRKSARSIISTVATVGILGFALALLYEKHHEKSLFAHVWNLVLESAAWQSDPIRRVFRPLGISSHRHQ